MSLASSPVQLFGDKEIMAKLRQMDLHQQKVAIIKGLKAAAKIIQTDAKRRASTDPKVRTGTLRRAIQVKQGRRKKGRLVYQLLFRKTAIPRLVSHTKAEGVRYFYPAAVEYGHKGPKADSPHTPAHPFIRPAYDAKKQDAVDAIRKAIREGLPK